MAKPKQEQAFLSVGDIRDRLGISYATAHELMNRLPHVDISRPGSRYRLRRLPVRELERYLKQREVRVHEAY